jgi:thiol-disulfide isomerase/thioredoxin
MSKILKLSANWCAPCKQMDIQLDRLGLSVEHFDIEVSKDMARDFNIRSIPTLIKLSDSGEEVFRLIGVQTDAKLMEFFA